MNERTNLHPIQQQARGACDSHPQNLCFPSSNSQGVAPTAGVPPSKMQGLRPRSLPSQSLEVRAAVGLPEFLTVRNKEVGGYSKCQNSSRLTEQQRRRKPGTEYLGSGGLPRSVATGPWHVCINVPVLRSQGPWPLLLTLGAGISVWQHELYITKPEEISGSSLQFYVATGLLHPLLNTHQTCSGV